MSDDQLTDDLISLARRAPDPEAMGRIRRVVNTAHKWGGDGRRPKFRKIKRVLMRRHPEVIARAFGGNANVAAAWIKNNWYRMRGQDPPPTRGRRKTMTASLDDYLEVPRDVFGDGDGAELFCANVAEEGEGARIWVTALRTGTWKVNPVRGKRGPLVIDREFLDDVMEAWRENAWEYVTVPAYHTDSDVMANTGFVRDLKVVEDPDRAGHYLLRAAIEFTEPEVEERVRRRSIAGVSVNVKFNLQHPQTGKRFKKVLTHLALTNMPFISGLRAFEQRLVASSDVISSYEFDVPDAGDVLLALGGTLWNHDQDVEHVRQQIAAQLSAIQADGEGLPVDPRMSGTPATEVRDAHWYVLGMSTTHVLICGHATEEGESYAQPGDREAWVAAYDMDDDGEVVLDSVDQWVHVEERWVRVDDDDDDDDGAVTAHLNSTTEMPIWMWNGTATSNYEFAVSMPPRGGDSMTTGVEEEQEQEQEQPQPQDRDATFTREDLDRIADERAQAALESYRQEVQERDQSRDDELMATRRQLHEMTVSRRVEELTTHGHAPALVQLAREIMLADVRGDVVLSLNREDGEINLSATDIVTELLEAIPATALTATVVALPDGSDRPDEDDVSARADRIMELLK